MHKYVKLQIGVKCINIHLKKNEKDSKAENKVNNRDKSYFPINNSICPKTELSHVAIVRAESPKTPSPGQRPGYNSNQQGAL